MTDPVPPAAAGPAAVPVPHGDRAPRARRSLAARLRSLRDWLDWDARLTWLVVGVVLLFVLGLTPTPYVLRQPGPVFNAIGAVQFEDEDAPVEVITIDGAESYPTGEGQLDVLTVNIAGSPVSQPGWVEAFAAYLTPSRDVLPVEAYYPDGQSATQREEENAAAMQSSQSAAIAAALRQLGYEVPTTVTVTQVTADGAAAGVLQPGDVLLGVDGVAIDAAAGVRAAIAELDGDTPVQIELLRDGERLEVTATPRIGTVDGQEQALLGIVVSGDYDFPVDVTIQLEDVGGPSAGLVFALSIVDKLTPGELTGGLHLAGTGTITEDGDVGAIGGVRQKLYAAADAGAAAFLLPVDNCQEALSGGVPGGLPLYPVENLQQAIGVIETLAAGAPSDGLASCPAVVPSGS